MSQNLLLDTRQTKIMVVDNGRERKNDFVLVGEKIEEVESFVYIGSLINTKGSSAQKIRMRLAMGRRAVQNMVSVWKSRGMSLGLKVRLLRATAFPISIYDCESWAMTSGDKKGARTRSVLTLSNCGVIQYGLGCHGRRGKRTIGWWRRLGLF